VKRKIFAALLLAFIAIASALTISQFSFREMMGTIEALSAPNEKLTKLNKVFEEITTLDQQQRAEAIENPEKPYKYFLDQSGYIHLMLDSLNAMPWDSVQLGRLRSLDDLLVKRNELFVSYLKVRAEIADNREFSHQLDTLSNLLKEAQRNADSSVVTTQQKTIKTYLQPDSGKVVKNDKGFLRRLFSKKKPKPDEKAPVKVQEELKVTVDTVAVAKTTIDYAEIEKLMADLESDQKNQRKKLQEKELELINANSLFVSQILNTLHEVENEEIAKIRASNAEASKVFDQGISRMTLIMLAFFLVAAFLIYLIFIDISRSNYYKQQLEKARDQAEELSKVKQRFLANMSHEIRTPLQSIIGFAEQLKDHPQGKEEAVEAIHSSSEHLLHIVNEVLDFSRISSGNFTLAKDPFRLLTLVKEVESAMRIQAEKKNVTFILDTEKATDFRLSGDGFRLRQILYNLLGNAIKFTHRGFVRLTVKTQELEQHVHTVFEVTDSGIGMTSEELRNVFNQFEQANADITKKYGGTGLGLSIVKALVDVHQGELHVSSELGSGSTFSVKLTYEKAVSSSHRESRSNEQPTQSVIGKVIFVDDDAMILKLCGLILKKNKIDHATYQHAEELANSKAIDNVTHIFIDIRMPQINGVELCKILKPRYTKAKFFALTAHVLPEERSGLLKEGFDSVLTKPFHEAELLSALGTTSRAVVGEEELPDFSLVRQMTMGDESLFQSIIHQFIEESENDLKRLKENLIVGNKKGVRETVHKLAGRIGQMGIYSLSAKFHEVEVNIVEGKSLTELEGEIHELVNELATLLKNIRLKTIAA
jgi:signal transduction histidine kinase/DNA-binding response OmpR family regulator